MEKKVFRMRQQIVQEISNALNRMEDTGKVDMSILENLQELRRFLRKIKTKWLEHPNTDGFYFYQAARNIELILGRMEDRFKNSQKMNDNPKIAKDSLILMPAIDKALKITETNEISDSSINMVLEETRRLRDAAANTNLIEPLEIDRESIDKDTLRLRFTELMDKLGVLPDDKYRINDDA